MKLIRSIAAAAVVGLLASTALAQAQSMKAQEFVTMAASSDMMEIRSSEIALEKAQNAAVKEFAQMMINDHTAASKGLMTAAQQDGVAMPAAMTEKHAAKVEALGETPAASFDAAYIDAQVAAHQEAVKLMTSYAEAGDGPALKAHAQKTAPVIQMHLEHVQTLDKQM